MKDILEGLTKIKSNEDLQAILELRKGNSIVVIYLLKQNGLRGPTIEGGEGHDVQFKVMRITMLQLKVMRVTLPIRMGT